MRFVAFSLTLLVCQGFRVVCIVGMCVRVCQVALPSDTIQPQSDQTAQDGDNGERPAAGEGMTAETAGKDQEQPQPQDQGEAQEQSETQPGEGQEQAQEQPGEQAQGQEQSQTQRGDDEKPQ